MLSIKWFAAVSLQFIVMPNQEGVDPVQTKQVMLGTKTSREDIVSTLVYVIMCEREASICRF